MVTRAWCLLFAVPILGFCADREQTFLSELSAQPASRIQTELGITEEDAAALIAIARDYQDQFKAVDAALHKAVFERRMARMSGEGKESATDAQLLEAQQRLTAQIASGQMQELRARLGESKFQRIQHFMASRDEGESYFPVPLSPRAAGKSKAVTVPRR